MQSSDWLQFAVLIVALGVSIPILGGYMAKVFGDGAAPGALYMPFASTAPQPDAEAHAAPCTCQTTFWLLLPRTVATNPCAASGASVTLAGCTETTT